MHRTFQKMEDQIINSWRLINNVIKDEKVLLDFSCYGYDENKINDGQALYEKTVRAVEKKENALKVYIQACTDADEKSKQAYHVYMVYLKLIKRSYNSKSSEGKRTVIQDGTENGGNWVESARSFYSSIITDQEALDFLAKRRLSIDKMKEGLKALDDFEASHSRKEAAKDKVLSATLERNALLERLLNWTSKILVDSSQIYRNNPDILDRLSGCCTNYDVAVPVAN
jgi:hypothetical protein